MRDAPAGILTCALAASLWLASPAGAQVVAPGAVANDLVPYENEMEASGDPPMTTPPPAAAVIDTAAPAPGSSPPALSANAQLMERLLIASTEKTIRQQKFAAAQGITAGGILLGVGVWRLVEEPPQSEFTRGLGAMFMTLGAANLTTGIFAATRIPHEKKRLERWHRAAEGGVTELELARAEGELLSAAETRNGERHLIRWNGLAHALAGAVILGVSTVPDNSTADRVSAWVIGGLFIATGSVAFGFSFRPTPSEVAWKTYQEQQTLSTAKQVSWRLSPAISRRSFGLGMSGTF